MRNKGLVALSASLVVGLLAACGSGSAGQSSSAAGSSGASTGCDGKISGPVTIKITTHAVNDPKRNPNPIKIYQDVIDTFNATVGKQKGITAEVVSFSENAYEKQLTAAIQAGQTPDAVEVDAPFVGSFAYQDVIKPLGNCATADKLSSIIPSVVANGKYHGQQYTLGAYDGGMGLWVSKKALAKVHARIPKGSADAWSAEEFDKILKDLKAAGYATPLNIEWGYGAGEWRAFGFGPVLLSAGTGILKADNSGADGALNSPQAVAAMTMFQKWAKSGLFDLSTAAGANDANFTSGKSAIAWVGHWMEGAYRDALKDDLGLVPLPNFGSGSKVYTGSYSFGMARGSKADPDAVWALMDYLTGPVASKSLADSEHAIPANLAVFDADPAYKPNGSRYLYAQNLKDPAIAYPRPVTPAYLVARDQFSTAFGDIIAGADVTSALNKAVGKIEDDIKANRGYPAS
jgi:multiple sugar transport system substrate-binding protein